MNNPTANRQTLKTYFTTNCVPTESQFYDLIDGMINQADDGLFKQQGNPLSIVAARTAPTQNVLNIYASPPSNSSPNPAWMLQLIPPSNPSGTITANPGLSISNGTGIGNSRLYIDNVTNNVGIGTTNPSATLDINGGVKVNNALTVGGSATFNNALTVNAAATFNNALTIGVPSSNNALTVNAPATFENAFAVNAAATFNNALTIGAPSSNNALTVNAPTTFNKTLTINGTINNTMWSYTHLYGNESMSNMPITTSFKSNGGSLLIFVSGSGYWSGTSSSFDTSDHFQEIGVEIQIGNFSSYHMKVGTNIQGLHCSFIPITICINRADYSNNTHNITLTCMPETTTDLNDYLNITIIEFPF